MPDGLRILDCLRTFFSSFPSYNLHTVGPGLFLDDSSDCGTRPTPCALSIRGTFDSSLSAVDFTDLCLPGATFSCALCAAKPD